MKKMKKILLLKRIQFGLILVFILSKIDPAIGQEAIQKENLNVFDSWIDWTDGKDMLVHHLNKQAFAYLDARDKEIAALKTKEDWIKRQNKVTRYSYE